MKAIIMSGGKTPSSNLLKDYLYHSEVLISCDSGSNYLYELNIVPDYILGDFDSINPTILDYYKRTSCKIETYPKEKDYTDTELAFYKALELGAKEILFMGCTGTRLDHVIGNLGLLKKCLEHNITGKIIDDNNEIFLVKESITLKGERGKLFSVQAFGDNVYDLTINGAKYPLNNYELRIGDPRTISNEFWDDEVSLDFNCGNLLIIYPRD